MRPEPDEPRRRRNVNSSMEKRQCSVFELPPTFFDSCRLLPSPSSLILDSEPGPPPIAPHEEVAGSSVSKDVVVQRLSCNTCKAEFESLLEQRTHFKSDFHRFNVKLSIAGKKILKEEEFDERASDSAVNDFDVSSISGSEDESDRELGLSSGTFSGKGRLFVSTQAGDRISLWKILVLDEAQHVSFDKNKSGDGELGESEVVDKLRKLVNEGRDGTCLRIVLLASGGHFAGCVFDVNSVVAHKTFHRYVVRAKAGKKQSSKDGAGRAPHSAGASLRRYNELALKKDIQELLLSWKPYFDASVCIYTNAASSSRQLLFNGDKPYFNAKSCAVRNVPLTVRRPTFKEARRVYNQLALVAYEVETREKYSASSSISERNDYLGSVDDVGNKSRTSKATEASWNEKILNELSISNDNDSEIMGKSKTTPLHEAVKSGNAHQVLELLDQGLDPCLKDERGRTPYMLAIEKEMRNTFRRFMASNLDTWDWNAAKVPSALTKEMEESQAAKQTEKDAKRKAKAKELKKLWKAKEKKAQEAAVAPEHHIAASTIKKQPAGGAPANKEEESKRSRDVEREMRAAAAERRLAAASAAGNTQGVSFSTSASSSLLCNSGLGDETTCSLCESSLVGIIPFHRYYYKYCSTACMRMHREILEDG